MNRTPPHASIVRESRSLDALCARLRAAGSFALDTEFVRERTFFIRLGIIQVATEEEAFIVDPHPIETLDSLLDLVSDGKVEKIVHAGEQDLGVLFERSGRPPRNVFDCQIVAALVGYGEQVSYGRLVEKVTGVKLSKTETLTDWTARPLTPAQIEYALEDVRYLPRVRKKLGEEVETLGRGGWVKEELRYLEDERTYTRPEPREYYRRIKARGLNGAQLGVLRELAAWREEEAIRRDVPRGWIVRDAALVDLARKKPASMGELRRVRQLKPQELERNGGAILAAVRRGLSDPVREPAERAPHLPQTKVEPLSRLLDAWLHYRAYETRIAPAMLASRDDLRAVVTAHLLAGRAAVPVMEGWRYELVGKEMVEILDGRRSVAVDRTTSHLASSSVEP